MKQIYPEGRINFSSETIKNAKIVPLEVSRDNVLVFTN